MWRAKDLSGLLLLYSAKGSADGMQKLVDLSKEQGKQNVAFLGLFLLGQLDECVDLLVSTGRTPEAAFFARTYIPSRVSEVRHYSYRLYTRGCLLCANIHPKPSQRGVP